MSEQNEVPAYFKEIEQYFYKRPGNALVLRFEEGILTKVIIKGKEHEVPFSIYTQDVIVENNNGNYQITGNWLEARKHWEEQKKQGLIDDESKHTNWLGRLMKMSKSTEETVIAANQI